MHSKSVLFFIVAFFAAFATANYIPPTTTTTTVTVTAPAPTETVSQCNTGSISCCNTVQSASSAPISALLGLLGIVLGDVTGLVGLGCAPILSSVSCTQQPVCCTGNTFNGLINIGCSPISL